MIVLAFLTVLCASLVCADDDDWKPNHRDYVVEINGGSLEVEASYRNGTYEDEFEVEIMVSRDNDLVDIEFEYQTTTQGNETEIELELQITGIVEFLATVENPSYTDTSTVVSEWPSAKVSWAPWQDETETVNGITLYKYSATTTTGLFTVRVHMAGKPVSLPGLLIDPNSVKIDFEINNYAYVNNNATRLALRTHVKSKTSSQQAGSLAVKEYRLLFTDDPDLPLGIFAWAPTITTNEGKSADVVAWTPNSEIGKEFEVYFTYMTPLDHHPSNLIWDPVVGLDYETPAPSPPPQFCMGDLCGTPAIAVICSLLSGVVVFAVLALIIYSYRKRQQYQPL